MKKLLALLPLCLLLTGCEERAAEFARKADELLKEYRQRVEAQISESTKYYQVAATLSAAQTERVEIESLQAERTERATQLEADYREGRKPVSLYRNDLRSYAEVDYAQLKARLTADLDATAPYLSQLVTLEADKATIEAFDKILKNLAKPRGIKDEVADIQKFVDDSKKEFGKLVCEDIAKQLNASPAPAADQIATLKALQKSEGCPTK